MKQIFLFDVDGTLTEPRQPMNDGFADFFANWAKHRWCYLISGSDYPKVSEQVPQSVLGNVSGVYACAGSEFWVDGRRASRRNHAFPEEIVNMLEDFLTQSTYPFRLGGHIEPRSAMLNFSVVGRNASTAEREMYTAWDREHGERERLVGLLSSWFVGYEFSVGGQISIDISPKGVNKAQVLASLDDMHGRCRYTFFGDRMAPGGNDWPLAQALSHRPGSTAIEVSGFHELDEHLRHASIDDCPKRTTVPGATRSGHWARFWPNLESKPRTARTADLAA